MTRLIVTLAAAAAVTVAGCTGSPDPPPAPAPAAAVESDPRFAEAKRLYEARDWAAAAAAYARVGEEAQSGGDTEATWRAALGECRSTVQVQRFTEQALACFERVSTAAAGVAEREVETAYHACLTTLRVGRMEDAEAWAARADRAALHTEDPRSKSLAYGTFGNVRSYQGRYRESMDWNERRVAVWRAAAPASSDLALALNNVAIDYRHLGRYDEAAAALEEAIEIHRARGEEAGLVPALYNLANVRSHAGDQAGMLALKHQALAMSEKTGNRAGIGFGLHDLGDLRREAGDHARARDYLERALAIHREDKRAYGETRVLASLARLELDLARPPEAEALARQAMELADEGGLGKEQGLTRGLLARALARRGDAEGALALAQEALRRAVALEDPDVELEAREALADVLEVLGRTAEAAEAYVAAVDLLDSLRGRLELGDLRLGVADPYLAAHEGAIRTLLVLRRDAEAFAVSERAKARMLLELIAEHAARDPRDRIAELRSLLRERYAEASVAEPPRRAALEAELRRIEAELDAAIFEERALEPARAASRHPRPHAVAEIREALVRPDRPLVAWFWGERDVYGFCLDAAGIRGRVLGPAAPLAQQVEFLHQTLSSADGAADWRPAALAVYRKLVAPLGAAFAREVVVVPDGPLLRVPLEALAIERGGEPVGARQTLYYGPSASVLAALATAPRAAPIDRDLLAVGVSAGSATGPEGRHGDEVPLPHAADEVRAIAEALGDRKCDVLLGKQATLPQFLERRPERYRWLHFATHARIVGRPADRSSLRLYRGSLDLPAVRALRLHAEIVTLSACETALGQRLGGEGVIGLTHAFLSAGARGVVASLWKVEDRATAEFMEAFYRRLGTGLPPATALRETRSAFLTDRTGGHPSVWAAFVLVGGLPSTPMPGSSL